MTRVYVAAGSNVDPERNLARACEEAAKSWPDAWFSHAYRNRAVGFDGPDFLNMVMGFHTTETVDQVIARLREIETLCGRARNAPKWASRSMDLDILLFGGRIETTPDYTLPRPDLLRRPYMLGPLAEIGAGVQHPTAGKTIGELWEAFDRDAHPMERVPIMLPSRR